jgi:hypothetical protein
MPALGFLAGHMLFFIRSREQLNILKMADHGPASTVKTHVRHSSMLDASWFSSLHRSRVLSFPNDELTSKKSLSAPVSTVGTALSVHIVILQPLQCVSTCTQPLISLPSLEFVQLAPS